MTHYEMLTVIPGTLTETEVAPVVATIKDTLASHDGADVTVYDMGKSRLAYPMQHIRYGYFYLVHFTAEPEVMRDLTKRVRLVNNVLRLVVRSFDPSQPRLDARNLKLTPLASVVGNAETETTPTSQFRSVQPAREMRREITTEPGSLEVKITTPNDGKISLEEIGEKLDEILEHDLEKV